MEMKSIIQCQLAVNFKRNCENLTMCPLLKNSLIIPTMTMTMTTATFSVSSFTNYPIENYSNEFKTWMRFFYCASRQHFQLVFIRIMRLNKHYAQAIKIKMLLSFTFIRQLLIIPIFIQFFCFVFVVVIIIIYSAEFPLLLFWSALEQEKLSNYCDYGIYYHTAHL